MLLGLLLAAQIVVSLLLIGVVLLQRSEGGGFVGGGSPSGMMSVRGAGDLMTRITWILGSLFFIIRLLLTILAGWDAQERVLALRLDRDLDIILGAGQAEVRPIALGQIVEQCRHLDDPQLARDRRLGVGAHSEAEVMNFKDQRAV